uniref:ZP domain-containing protein n=1 Tax=Amphiprion percula TaxID=161767 RepID=A0A3P8TQN9_AMPPE
MLTCIKSSTTKKKHLSPFQTWVWLHCYHDSRFRNRAGNGVFLQDPELEWERRATVMGEEKTEASVPKSKLWRSASADAASLPGAYKYEYLRVPYANDRKEDFKPQKGARPLSGWAKKILLGHTPTIPLAREAGDRHKLVEILCHVDRLYVRIKREVFKSRDAYKYLKLGTCPVNHANDKYYYLLYLLKNDCGFKKEVGDVLFSIYCSVLSYKPTSVVLREMPFDIPLQSSGKDITGIKSYILGQLMFFQASGAVSTPSSGKERLYINKCFVTTSQDPNSHVKYTVIDNYGCMIDGKVTLQSKFLPANSKKVQKFSVGAFIFKNTASTTSQQHLYMHCEISMGPLSPTPTSKACNFNPATKKWVALYGKDCICACCDSTCSSGKHKGKFQPFLFTRSGKRKSL